VSIEARRRADPVLRHAIDEQRRPRRPPQSASGPDMVATIAPATLQKARSARIGRQCGSSVRC